MLIDSSILNSFLVFPSPSNQAKVVDKHDSDYPAAIPTTWNWELVKLGSPRLHFDFTLDLSYWCVFSPSILTAGGTNDMTIYLFLLKTFYGLAFRKHNILAPRYIGTVPICFSGKPVTFMIIMSYFSDKIK